MSETATLVGPRSALRATRLVLWVILALAVIAGVSTLIGGAFALADEFGGGGIHLTLVADKSVPAFGGVGGSGSTAMRIVGATYPAAELTLQGAGGGVLVLAIVSAVALLLTQLALCALVAALAWRLLRGGVFRRSIAVTVTAAGGVLAIGGLLSQASNAFGGALAASELNGGGRGFWPLAGRFDPTLMVFGFVLLLVGLAFDYGSRLQKESEGLV